MMETSMWCAFKGSRQLLRKGLRGRRHVREWEQARAVYPRSDRRLAAARLAKWAVAGLRAMQHQGSAPSPHLRQLSQAVERVNIRRGEALVPASRVWMQREHGGRLRRWRRACLSGLPLHFLNAVRNKHCWCPARCSTAAGMLPLLLLLPLLPLTASWSRSTA